MGNEVAYTEILFAYSDHEQTQIAVNKLIKQELNRTCTRYPYVLSYMSNGSRRMRMRTKHYVLWAMTWNERNSPYLQYVTV